jgi:hypothetical protein
MADLITVNEYKDAEGLRGEKDDDRLAIIVPQISDLVKKYITCIIVCIFHYYQQKILKINEIIQNINCKIYNYSKSDFQN